VKAFFVLGLIYGKFKSWFFCVTPKFVGKEGFVTLERKILKNLFFSSRATEVPWNRLP